MKSTPAKTELEKILIDFLADISARINHIAALQKAQTQVLYEEKPSLHVDPTMLSIEYQGQVVGPLTAKELQIVSLLNSAPTRALSREDLVKQIWHSVKVSSKTLDVHIFNLRRKIAPLGIEIVFSHPNVFSLKIPTQVVTTTSTVTSFSARAI